MGLIDSWILSVKVFLISAGALSTAMAIKVSVPAAVKEIPVMWSTILSWLKPPYLYLLINGIIITVLASSRFQQVRHESEPPVRGERLVSVGTPPPATFASFSAQPEVRTVAEDLQAAVVVREIEDRVVELRPVVVNGSRVDIDEAEPEDLLLESTSTLSPETTSTEIQLEYLSPVEEKTLDSSRFGRRKTNRATAKGAMARRPARQTGQETLESAWKMITAGRNVPITGERDSPPASSGIRKEPSLGQDELNRRVEDFIKKINDKRRLQRQKSLGQYKQMVGGGAQS